MYLNCSARLLASPKSSMKEVKYQKRIRLKDFSYEGFYRYFVTLVSDRKIPLFKNIRITRKILSILKNISKRYGFLIWVYCFMPEHLHLLIEGEKENSNMKKFISMFKQKTSYTYKKSTNRKLWQENYYEHILRKDEDTKDIARYILENPVRRRLVKKFTDYKFLGSFIFDIKEL